MTTTPARSASAMLSTTPATSPELGSERITTSTAAASSAGLAATVAPCSPRASAAGA
jgi:hypothetical protein